MTAYNSPNNDTQSKSLSPKPETPPRKRSVLTDVVPLALAVVVALACVVAPKLGLPDATASASELDKAIAGYYVGVSADAPAPDTTDAHDADDPTGGFGDAPVALASDDNEPVNLTDDDATPSDNDHATPFDNGEPSLHQLVSMMDMHANGWVEDIINIQPDEENPGKGNFVGTGTITGAKWHLSIYAGTFHKTGVVAIAYFTSGDDQISLEHDCYSNFEPDTSALMDLTVYRSVLDGAHNTEHEVFISADINLFEMVPVYDADGIVIGYNNKVVGTE